MRQLNLSTSHIQRHRITRQVAPPVLVMLAKSQRPRSMIFISGPTILCGAAPLSKDWNRSQHQIQSQVVQTWGMTEVTCSCLHVPGGMDDRNPEVGQVGPNSTIKLIDESGNKVTKPGQRGEIFVRGPNAKFTRALVFPFL